MFFIRVISHHLCDIEWLEKQTEANLKIPTMPADFAIEEKPPKAAFSRVVNNSISKTVWLWPWIFLLTLSISLFRI